MKAYRVISYHLTTAVMMVGTAAASMCSTVLAFEANAYIQYKIIKTLYLGSHPLLVIRSQKHEANLEITKTPITAVKKYFSEKIASHSTTVVMLLANLQNFKIRITYPARNRSHKTRGK